jgi:hypothetical protein
MRKSEFEKKPSFFRLRPLVVGLTKDEVGLLFCSESYFKGLCSFKVNFDQNKVYP